MNAITFGGGGGKKPKTPPTPVNIQDNLASADRVEAILGLCHGPIKGLTNGHRSFRVGDTRLQNADGSYNFNLFSLTVNPGDTPGEQIVPVLGGMEDFRNVDQALPYGAMVFGLTAGSGPQQIVLRFRVNALYQRGYLSNLPPGVAAVETDIPHTWKYKVMYRQVGAAEWTNPALAGGAELFELTGKTRVPEIHELRLLLPPMSGPVEIVVHNYTPTSDAAPCNIHWVGFFEVTAGAFGLTRSHTVSTSLEPALAVTRTTDQPGQRRDGTYGIDYIELRFIVNQLYFQRESEGQAAIPGEFEEGGTTPGVWSNKIDLLLEVKPSSGSTWQRPFESESNPAGTVDIYGKKTTPFVFEMRCSVVPIDDTYDVRVTRVSPNNPNHFRDIQWESFQEIVGGAVAFDGVATCHMVAQATDQFSSLPDLWGEYDAMMVRIPTNYDPYTRTYDGPWDGTFKIDWTNNNAWILHELIMNETWGAKRYWTRVNVNKWDFYSAGQWCDEAVPDGKGGYHPRYSLNLVLSDVKGVKELLRYVAGTFNAVLRDDLNGSIGIIVDKDDAPAAIFAPENVVDGMFDYAFTDTTTHFNHVTGKFLNPLLDYEEDLRIVYDQAHIDRFGVIPMEFAAIGCTDPQECIRRCAYKMLTATTEVMGVSFQTNRVGLFLEPMSVILIADPDMEYSMTSRVFRIDDRNVYLHEPVYIEPGVQYEAKFQGIDPETKELTVISIPVESNIVGTTSAITLYDDPPNYPWLPEEAVVSIGAVGTEAGTPKPFRITAIEPVDDDPDLIRIEAIEINRNKWFLSDNATDRAGFDILNYPASLVPPTSPMISTEVIDVNGELVPNMVVTWVPSEDPRVSQYGVEIRRSGESVWQPVAVTATSRVEVSHISNGTYDARVRAEGYGGKTSEWVGIYGVEAGLDAPPTDVALLNIVLIGDQFELRWPGIPDRDLSHYRVRFHPDMADAPWADAVDVVGVSRANVVRVSAVPGTYLVKAVDLSGRESHNAATANTSSTGLSLNAIDDITHGPAFPGTKTDLTVDGLLMKLDADANEGTYEFWTPTYVDADDPPATMRIAMFPRLSGERSDLMMSDWTNLAALESLSGVREGDYRVEYEIDTDDGAGWRPFAVGDWKGRHFGFRLRLIRVNPIVTPVVLSIRVVIDVPDRTERGANLLVNETKHLVFSSPFMVPPTIVTTGKNLAIGERVYITSDRFGFSITVLNNSNSVVTRYVDWLAVGYGGR